MDFGKIQEIAISILRNIMRRKELADFPFDKEAFQKIIIKARGSMSQMKFCETCGLSYAYMNRYANAKNVDAPTISTIKKIALATNTVTYEELLEAAGYNPDKYKDDRPVGVPKKDFLYPVFIGMVNSSYDWRIESSGYKDNEPFEILIERADVKKWFFIPVMKKDVTKEDIQNVILNQPRFSPGSKVSFVTDDEGIFNRLKDIEFPLLSLYVSAVLVNLSVVIEEVKIKTSIDIDLTVKNEDMLRPLIIGENGGVI